MTRWICLTLFYQPFLNCVQHCWDVASSCEPVPKLSQLCRPGENPCISTPTTVHAAGSDGVRLGQSIWTPSEPAECILWGVGDEGQSVSGWGVGVLSFICLCCLLRPILDGSAIRASSLCGSWERGEFFTLELISGPVLKLFESHPAMEGQVCVCKEAWRSWGGWK